MQQPVDVKSIVKEDIPTFKATKGDYLGQANDLFKTLYGKRSQRLTNLMRDVYNLYIGNWDSHEACQVSYHTLEHIMEVMLASGRMVVGWNKAQNKNKQLNSEDFLIAIAAALFHDSGYLKDKGDLVGNGGKLTYVHVNRSQTIAAAYLKKKKWKTCSIEMVDRIIATTEFNQPVKLEGELARFPGNILSGIVGTADLIAQMADVYYMERLPSLFSEFQEAYLFEDTNKLEKRGIKIFKSVQEMIDATPQFFELFVNPRLNAFGRMDKYLSVFFDEEDRNPYIESICTNLYRTTLSEDYNPQLRIGELIHEEGLVKKEILNQALIKQNAKNKSKKNKSGHCVFDDLIDELIECLRDSSQEHCLGEILLNMGEIEPSELNRVADEHLLSTSLVEGMTCKEYTQILRIGILLSNIRYLPKTFSTMMDMLNKLLDCQTSTLLLVHLQSNTLIRVISSGTLRQDLETIKTIPLDKGVAGWVFHNNNPVIIDEVNLDHRFANENKQKSKFKTHSIMAIPLIIGGEVKGVIEAINKQGGKQVFTEKDLNILRIITKQLSGALDSFFWVLEKNTTQKNK